MDAEPSWAAVEVEGLVDRIKECTPCAVRGINQGG
jgi:hypothetical protein